MEILSKQISLDKFFRRLRDCRRSLLFLDYDGTLAPFREKRDEAVPYPGLPDLLADLASLDGVRLVFVTGRAVRDLKPLLGRAAEGVEIWGSHGRERLHRDGRYETLGLSPEAGEALDDALHWTSARGLNLHSELKVGCVALHHRSMGREEREETFAEARKVWSELAERAGLELHEFDGGIELKVPGRSKGDAVNAVLAEVPEAVAAYLGDDLTDEDAFRALEGKGLRVLVREEQRETAADLWITPPEELKRFLEMWRDSLRT